MGGIQRKKNRDSESEQKLEGQQQAGEQTKTLDARMTSPKEEGDLEEAERTEFLAAMERDFEAGQTESGEIVTGTILSVGEDMVFVDLGGKSEGILSLEELKGENGSLPAVGDVVEASVLSSGPDRIVLSKCLARGIRSREFLEQAAQTRIPVEGRVVGRNKGGFEVEVAGIRGFCPVGQIELRYCEDPDVHLDKKYTFVITKYDDSGRRPDLVLSRRELLQAESEKKAEELRKTLKEGDIINGTVSSVREFGAFVDLGGVEGLLHVSEISHQHTSDPREVLKEGEEIHVQVIAIEQEGGRISLSLKRLEADPWNEVLLSFPEGAMVRGKVVRLVPFGAFVQLAPGIDGLIHISNLGTSERVSHPRAVLADGQEVLVEVLSVEPEKRKIGLARIPEKGELDQIPMVGEVVEGKVDNVTDFGVFVILGRGRKGLVPNAEMGTPRGVDHRKQFPPGTPIKVQVMEVTDNGKKIRLSRRAALLAEEKADFEGYSKGEVGEPSEGFGKLGDLMNKKFKS